jgi:thiosulfate/3-mercaptopyruvate sulfurtransferase
MDGGWASWVKAGYPVSEELPNSVEGSFTVNWNDELWADKSNVVHALKDENVILVDVRDDEEWRAETSSPYGKDFAPRMGRIPKAVHLNWKELMYVEDNITHLRSGSEVSKICEKKDIKNDKNIIVYCFKGARASNSLIALKRAGFNVKNYFASWNEWSRDFELPIEN